MSSPCTRRLTDSIVKSVSGPPRLSYNAPLGSNSGHTKTLIFVDIFHFLAAQAIELASTIIVSV